LKVFEKLRTIPLVDCSFAKAGSVFNLFLNFDQKLGMCYFSRN